MLNKKYNILVTAVGGDIGQAIVKVLRRIPFVYRIVGTDTSSDNAGMGFVDKFYIVPKAESPGYFTELEKVVKEEGVYFIIPVSEPEIKAVYEANHVHDWEPARLVIPGGQVLPTCLDKLATIKFLEAHGLPVPLTIPVEKGIIPKTPCILKDRWSWGSKSLTLIEDEETARFFSSRRPDSIFQEKLLPPEEEYTCGVFRTHLGEIKTVVLRRKLEGAQTGKAVVVKDLAIEDLCGRIATAFDLRGSINVQLIKTGKGPVPFEINPRFSSTVIFRELISFRDVLWSLLDLLGEDPGLSLFSPPIGTRFYRVLTEVVVPPSSNSI